MANTKPAFLNRHHRSALKLFRARVENRLEKVGDGFCFQPFDADANHGRFRGPGQGEQGMKVCIQRDDGAIVLKSLTKDFNILCRGQTYFTDMNRVNSR